MDTYDITLSLPDKNNIYNFIAQIKYVFLNLKNLVEGK